MRIKTLKALVWEGNSWRLYIEAHPHFQRHRQVPMASADIPKQTLADFLKWVRFWYCGLCWWDRRSTPPLWWESAWPGCNETLQRTGHLQVCSAGFYLVAASLLTWNSCCFVRMSAFVVIENQVLPHGAPCRKTVLVKPQFSAGQEGCFCWWWLETKRGSCELAWWFGVWKSPQSLILSLWQAAAALPHVLS